MAFDKLEGSGFKSNRYVCLGLKGEPGVIRIVVEASDAKLLGLSESGEIEVYEGDPETDPRPLYFIPFDPDVEQLPEEAAYARQALEQQVQSGLIAAIGKATPPTDVPVSADELLEKATWGMYSLWKNTDTRRHLRGKVHDFLNRVLPGKVHVDEGRRRIMLNTAEEKQEILGTLMRTKPESWKGAGDQLSFEDMEGRRSDN